MGTWGLMVRRARACLGLLLTILAVATGATAIIAGTIGYSQAAATTAARLALTETVPTEAGIQVQTRLAADPAVQDQEARRLIDSAFTPSPVRVQRTLGSDPRPVAGSSDTVVVLAGEALLPADPRFDRLVQVADGQWPDGPGPEGGPVPGALHRGAAEALGVTTGDTLVVGGTPVVVRAIWQPVDAQDPFWFANPLLVSGSEGGTDGPLVVDPAAIGGFGTQPFVRWTVQPDPDLVRPEDLPRMGAAAAELASTVKGSSVGVRGIVVEGDLAPTAALAGKQLQTAQALNAIPIVLLLLVSVISLVQIARLQAAARSAEGELLVARGASGPELLRWSLGESLVVVVLSTALGIGAALAVLSRVPAGEQQVPVVVGTGILTGAAILLALLLITALQVRSIARRRGTDRSGRTRTVAAVGTIVLTLGAAVLSWGQLFQYGTPLVTDADGSRHIDLLAGAAPALILAAVAVLTMTLLGPLTRFLEDAARRSRGTVAHLAASQVARRLLVYVVPVVLTVLAMGSTTVASLYAATSVGLRDDLSAVDQGAPVRVRLASPPNLAGSIPALPSVGQVGGVTADAPVWRTPTRVGTTKVPVTLLPVDRLDAVSELPQRALDVDAARRELAVAAPPPNGPTIPADATSLTIPYQVSLVAPPATATILKEGLVSIEQDARYQLGLSDRSEEQIQAALVAERARNLAMPSTDADLTAWIWDPTLLSLRKVPLGTLSLGFTVTVDGVAVDPKRPLDPPDPAANPFVDAADLDIEVRDPAPANGTATITLPPGVEGRRLVRLAVELPQYGIGYDATAAFGLLTDDGTDVLDEGAVSDWEVSLPPPGPDDARPQTAGRTATSADGLTLAARTGLDVTDSGAPQTVVLSSPLGDRDVLPIAVTSELAYANDLALGSTISMTLFGIPAEGTVVMIVPVVPGALDRYAMLLDARTAFGWIQRTGVPVPPPTELWVASRDPAATVAALGQVGGIQSVVGASAVSDTDTAEAVRLVFWVASAGAVVLAITGIAAVASTLLRTRRSEVAVLRALGMAPRSQAASRVCELSLVTLVAALVGVGAGLVVGRLAIPDLARSTTLDDWLPLDPVVQPELPLGAALVGTLALAMGVIVLVQFATVRAQALDTTYREEVR